MAQKIGTQYYFKIKTQLLKLKCHVICQLKSVRDGQTNLHVNKFVHIIGNKIPGTSYWKDINSTHW